MATITGTPSADSLFGSAGNDLLLGLEGDDTLFSSPGNDTLDGGRGSNTADYSFETRALRVDFTLGRATVGDKTDTLIGIQALYGGKGDDTLIGAQSSRELLDGGAGNDHLVGQGGDVLQGSSGSDRLESNSPGFGALVDYRRLDGPLRIDLETGLVSGEHKLDVLVNIDSIIGSQGDDVMQAKLRGPTIGGALSFAGVKFDGAGGHDTLHGGTGDDLLAGGEGNDLLLAFDGIDRLEGGPGDDTLDGGAGGDTLSYLQAAGAVQVDLAAGRASGEGNDVLRNIEAVFGSVFNDLLRGDSGNNRLSGYLGDDTLEGGDGNDTLLGARGLDVLRGGNGDDTLVAEDQDGVTIDGGAGNDTVILRSGSSAEVTLLDMASGLWTHDGRDTTMALTSVERVLYEGKGSATIYGDDGDNFLSANVVIGRGGNDTLEGETADYSAESAARTLSRDGLGWLARAGSEVDTLRVFELILGSGDDQMLGPWTAAGSLNIVYGGAGNDRLVGNELHGGAGDDTLVGQVASYTDSAGPVHVAMSTMTARGVDGNDQLVGIVRVDGTRFADTLMGGAADVFLDGGAGNDLIEGGTGNDTLIGRHGDDVLRGGAGDDELSAGDGNDTMDGGAGNDILRPGVGQLQIDGGAGIDLLLVGWSAGPLPEVNLRTGTLRWKDSADQTFSSTLRGIEAVHNRSGPMLVTGLDGPAAQRGETLIAGLYGDTFDGGTGIDMLALERVRTDYLVTLNTAGLPQQVRFTDSVRTNLAGRDPSYVNATHTLQSVERIHFSDSLLAFGDRAVDVAKVAFALWSPAIAPSATLFGKGIDWYDQGHSYRELIDFALTYYSGLSDAQLAQTLMTNVKSTRSHSEVLNLITQQGRAAATQLFADDAANMAQVELAGLKSNGITCAWAFDSEPLFALPG